MRIGFVAAAAALLTLAAASTAAPPKQTVLGASWVSGGSLLARYDAVTLRRTGPTLRVALPSWAWSFSPDGRTLALAGSDQDSGRLTLVDAQALRRLGSIQLGVGRVVRTAWLRTDRLLVVTGQEQGPLVLLLDPITRSEVRRVAIVGQLMRGERLQDALVLLVGPRQGIGPSRLLVLDAELGMREIPLPSIASGRKYLRSSIDPNDPSTFTSEIRLPGLAVDRSTNRAFVVGQDEPVAEVDLTTGRVAWHPRVVRRPAKFGNSGPSVTALALGGGKLAVTGTLYGGLDERTRRIRETPLGLTILDTRMWSARLVDPKAQGVLWSGRWLVRSGAGLTWYDRSGTARGRLFGTHPVGYVVVHGDRALVQQSAGFVAVDLRTGKVVGRCSVSPPRVLDGLSAPFGG